MTWLEGLKTRPISHNEAAIMLLVGVALLAVALSLAFYSIPSETPPLPSFPFLGVGFPLVPILLVVSVVLLASGWISFSDGSLGPFMVVSVAVIALGIIAKLLSMLFAVPLSFQGEIYYVEPYGTHTIMAAAIGLLLFFFGLLFYGLSRKSAVTTTA